MWFVLFRVGLWGFFMALTYFISFSLRFSGEFCVRLFWVFVVFSLYS